MTTRKEYSAAERRELLAAVHDALAKWTKPRGRTARVQLSQDHNALALLLHYNDTPAEVKTVRVPCDELREHGALHILRIISRELPLRPVPGRR